MTFSLDTHKTIPIGALLLLSSEKQEELIEQYFKLTGSKREILASARTGAYLRGLAKQFKLSSNQTQRLALIIFLHLVKRLKGTSMQEVITKQLNINPLTSKKIEASLEHDLFSNVSKKTIKEAGGTPDQPSNLLNLKPSSKNQ